MSTPAPTDAATGDAIEFAVDAERCIGCVACINVFPQIFRMDENTASAYAGVAAAEVLSSRVVNSCPVGAIRRVTPAPESGTAAVTSLEVVPGWETEWERHRRDPEDLLERERRYGRVYHASKLGSCYLLRIELPRRLPVHPALDMYGFVRRAPEYDCTLRSIGPDTLSVRARLLDPKLRHLTGKLNSLPIGLKVDYRFPEPIGPTYHRMDLDSIQVYAFPDGTTDSLVKLAATIRQQLAG